MELHFEKYHGTGNDFIILDNRDEKLSLSPHEIKHLCDRHLGVGADGLILLEKAKGYDFSMRYYNADGNESSMCGNGGRCITAFAAKHKIISKKALFIAADGEHKAELTGHNNGESMVRLQMKNVQTALWTNNTIFLDTGSPHLVVHTKNVAQYDVAQEGSRLRNHSLFEAIGGTNVNFVEALGDKLHIRTYERGVEAETLSCGTGVTAAGLAWAIKAGAGSPIELIARGGTLKVFFEQQDTEFTNIWLEGPASFVFSGRLEL